MESRKDSLLEEAGKRMREIKRKATLSFNVKHTGG